MSKKFLVPIDMSGLEIQNFLAHNLASAPTGVAGKVYFNTVDHKLYYHNGTVWVDLTAHVDPNEFGKIKVGSTLIEADAVQDTIEFVAGSNVTITPDATNDKVTIAATNTTYGQGTSEIIEAGTDTANRVWKATILHDYIEGLYEGVQEQLESVNDLIMDLSDDVNDKVDKENGKGLSTNDYTTAEKNKLAGIASGAEVNVQADWNQTTTTADDYIKNKPTIPADKVFFAIPDTTTYTELGNAVDAGKIVLAYYSNHLYTLTYRNGNSFGFSCVEYTGSTPFKILGMRAYQNAGTQTVWQHNLGYDIAKLASPEFTGTPKAPTATAGTNTTQIATTAFVKNAVDTAVTGATAYQGIAPTTFAPTNYKAGWYWIIGTAGTYCGQTCEAGDMIFCKTTASTYSASDFDIVQTNIEGAITSINGTSPISVTGSGSSRTVSISASSDSSAGSMSAAHYTKLNGLTATKTGTVTIASGSTSVDANVSNIIAYTAKDASTGEEVVIDVTKASNKVTFSIAASYTHAINITYLTTA